MRGPAIHATDGDGNVVLEAGADGMVSVVAPASVVAVDAPNEAHPDGDIAARDGQFAMVGGLPRKRAPLHVLLRGNMTDHPDAAEIAANTRCVRALDSTS